jgi:putative ABC transport system substrate-binding protein
MRRRDFIIGLGGAVALQAMDTFAQSAKLPRLAIISPFEPLTIMFENGGNPYYRVLFEDLRALGYVEDKTLAISRFSREAAAGGLEVMMTEVLRAQPDVIYAIGALAILKAATGAIPVVVLTADPIALGFAETLSRPGGKFTGVRVDAGPSLHGKRIELLREVFPKMSKLAYVTSRRAWDAFQGPPVRAAAEAARISLLPSLVGFPATEADYRDAVLTAGRAGADSVMIADSPESLLYRSAIVEAAAEARLPAIYTFPESAEAGGLIAYSFDLRELNHQAVRDIDAILRGANPGDIPFYQVTRLILSINLRTAGSLGLPIPPSILARADEVIE